MKKSYAFPAAASSSSSSSFKPSLKKSSNAVDSDNDDEEEEDHDRTTTTTTGGDEYLNKYFGGGKKPSAPPAAKKDSWIFQEEVDDDEQATSASEYKKLRWENKLVKRVRPKPDLNEEDYDAPAGEVVLSSQQASAPAKDLPARVLKRQRETERIHLMESEQERKRFLELKKQELKQQEQRRLKDKYWMREFLTGARRATEDKNIVLRKELLQESADKHTTGKNLYHNQFLVTDTSVAGRFFVEPQGNKPSEQNADDTVLYLFIDKTGSEGFTLRVDRKFFELFEGDVGIVPPGAVYSFVNPSKTAMCQFTYMLAPVTAAATMHEAPPAGQEPEEEDEEELNEEELFAYDFRGLKSAQQQANAGADKSSSSKE